MRGRRFSFGTSLAELTRGESVHGRRIEIRWARKEDQLRSWQVLFVDHSEAKRYAKIVQAVQGAAVLTVGEAPDFLGTGGILNFVSEGEALQFQINLVAAKEAHPKISSHLLAIARRVLNKPETAGL